MTDSRSQKVAAHMELVGTISAAWAVLELNIEMTIFELVGGDRERIACVTSQFSSHYPKLKAVIALCKERGLSPEIIKKLNGFNGALTKVADRRNRVIHDAWRVKGGEIIGKVNLPRVREPSDSTIPELKSLRQAINTKLLRYSEIRLEIKRELQALP